MDSNLNGRPLTIDQASEFTGYSRAYIYKLVHQKKIPHFKPEGGKVLFSLEDLKSFCFRNRQSASYELQEKAEAILNGGKHEY